MILLIRIIVISLPVRLFCAWNDVLFCYLLAEENQVTEKTTNDTLSASFILISVILVPVGLCRTFTSVLIW
jgi:hypothetical protein